MIIKATVSVIVDKEADLLMRRLGEVLELFHECNIPEPVKLRERGNTAAEVLLDMLSVTNEGFAPHWEKYVFTKGEKRFILSVQAGPYHYCFPPMQLKSLLDYYRVEVAVMKVDDGKFIQPSEVGLALDDNPCDDVLPDVDLGDVIAAINKLLEDGWTAGA
jgi:hypothetical protein